LRSRKLVAAILVFYSLFVLYLVFTQSSEREAVVTRVIDGDTFELKNGQKVRLLGMDAPEKGRQYHDEAMERLRQLVEGKRVILEKDVSNRDRYGRLLRYVYVDRLFVNLEMVKKGYAMLFTTPKNVKHLDEFMKAEEEAKLRGLGVWNFG